MGDFDESGLGEEYEQYEDEGWYEAVDRYAYLDDEPPF